MKIIFHSEYFETKNTCILLLLGVRSLANASRARQFNPLNPPGVGWVPLPQTNMAAVVGLARSCAVVRGRSCAVVRAWTVMHGRAWSCVVVRGRAWSCAVGRARSCVVMRGRAGSCVRGRSCVVVRGSAWSCVVVRGRARSCAVVRAWSVIRGRAWSCVVVRGRSCVVVRGRSCAVVRGRAVLPASRPALPWHERTNERTTYNNPLNPPGVGWVNFFILLRCEYLWAHACQIWERSDGRFENVVFQIYK